MQNTVKLLIIPRRLNTKFSEYCKCKNILKVLIIPRKKIKIFKVYNLSNSTLNLKINKRSVLN